MTASVQNDLTSTSAAAALNASTASSAQDLQNQFLTLLVTQMQNQDPLNPMDNSELTSQLAQISTVGGINQLNTTLQSLASNVGAQQSLQAAALVGHGVMVQGNQLSLSGGNAVFGVSLPQDVTSMVVTIKDGAGNVVDQMDVGAQSAGTVYLQWDGSTSAGGTASDGNYTFSVTASANGTSVTATPLSYGLVNGVTPGSNGTALTVQGIGSVQLSNIKQII
ncbi:MAG TPA: flagellar hook assembly protein FlgD [Burkholderiales bacterium]|nr:flagellar hook assembly protein FlgD [Burkholderiales bacterium]